MKLRKSPVFHVKVIKSISYYRFSGIKHKLLLLTFFLSWQVIEDPLQVERIKFAFETENGLIGK